MADHQHAEDSVPDGDTPSTGTPGAAGENTDAGADTSTEPGATTEPDAETDADTGTETRTGAAGAVKDTQNGVGMTAAEAAIGAAMAREYQAGPGSGAGPGSTDDPGAPGMTEGTSPAPPARFRRDRRHKMIAGVCAGLGRQCDMDPVIFRITLAVLSATGGIGLIFYGFAWLLVPYSDDDQNEVRRLLTGRVDGQALAAVLFALVGCGVFLSMLKNGGVLTFAVVLSLLLAGAGYWSRHRDSSAPDPLAAQAVADAPPEAQAPPAPTAYPSWWRDPIVKDGTHDGGTGYLWGPRDYRGRAFEAGIRVDLTGHGLPEDIPAPPGPSRRAAGPRWIGGWVFLFALAVGFAATRLTWDHQPLGTSLQAGLASALAVFGLGIAVSSFLGRTGAGSVFLAIVTAALLAASSALPKDVGTDWVDRTWRPVAVADVRESYDLGTGDATLDLSGLDLAKGQTARTSAEVGLGRLRVIVPPDATVKLSIDVGLGDIRLPGDNKKDVDVQPGRQKETTLPPQSDREGGKDSNDGGTLDLDLHVGVGQVEVSRAAS
ncbi:PspC domain-containing protein [Streptomyces antibioticus]|uniref:PspC domain-containing protein n=1 Tax=Streptomyces antibioticus TaxID=1890 RepID=UPI003F4C1618